MSLTRRSFLALSAALPFASRLNASKTKPSSIPIGLELYSVRDVLKTDLQGTVRAVAQMGYQCVEFYAPYYDWTEAQAKDMRKLLDDLGIRCYSTHNGEDYFKADKIEHARNLNLILGTHYMVMASSNPKPGLDGWKAVADELNAAADNLKSSGLKVGYHNHQPEFTKVDGVYPLEILAKSTHPSIMLQLDVGTCVSTGADPVAWIRSHPGRVRSLHLKDWSHEPTKGFQTLFGEGDAPWKQIFTAAESVGGVEYYLLEQEGSRYGELETAKRCLQGYHEMRA